MELIYFILSTYGICGFLSIINYRYIKKEIKILECPFCMGFWMGLILFLFNGYTDLFNFNITIFNAILMAFIGGASTYILAMIIDDNGIRIDRGDK